MNGMMNGGMLYGGMVLWLFWLVLMVVCLVYFIRGMSALTQIVMRLEGIERALLSQQGKGPSGPI